MYWFYRDEVTDPLLDPTLTHRMHACVIAVGSHAKKDEILLAGEGWGTQAEHEGRGWVSLGVLATPPALPVQA